MQPLVLDKAEVWKCYLLIELSGPQGSGTTNFWSFYSTKLIYGALKH